MNFIAALLLVLVFSISGVFAVWSYGGAWPTENSSVDTDLEEFPYYDWITNAPTSGNYVVYHSYSYDGVDRIYKYESYTSGGTVPVPEAPNVHRKVTFIGWSPLASHDSSTSGYNGFTTANPHTPYTYLPTSYSIPTEIKYTWNTNTSSYTTSEGTLENITHTDTIPVSEIIGYADSSGIIHLYDLYTSYKLVFPLEVDVSKAQESGNTRPLNIQFAMLKFGTSLSDKVSVPSTDVTIKRYQYANGGDLTTSGNKPAYLVNRYIYFHPGIGMWIKSIKYSGSAGYTWEGLVTLSGTGGGDGTYHDDTTFYMSRIGMVAPTITVAQNCLTSSGNQSGCVASGTLVTLADGSRIPIEELTMEHKLRVFDHEKGEYTTANILFIENDGYQLYDIVNCEFSNGTKLRVIGRHGLFDLTTHQYEYVSLATYQDLIGHEFALESESGYGKTTLVNAYVTTEYTGCYELPSEYHMNYFVEGMFSMPGGIPGLFNFFEYDENLAYDKEKMEEDIATYGLFTYDDFKQYMSEELFNSIFPVKYLKVSIGKGLTTMEGLEYILERYIYRYVTGN